MKTYSDDFKYKRGDIYLFKESLMFSGDSFFYTIKHIIKLDYNIKSERMYQYKFYHNILKQEIYGWDYESDVIAGKELLKEYLDSRGSEK